MPSFRGAGYGAGLPCGGKVKCLEAGPDHHAGQIPPGAARSERRKRARLRCHALEAPALQVQHGGDHRQTVSGRKQGIVACA